MTAYPDATVRAARWSLAAMTLAGLATLGITWLDLPLPAIVAGVGGLSCAWVYRCLRPGERAPG